MANEVLREMIRQFRMQNLTHNKEFLKVDDTTLRVQQKVRSGMKRKKGADIRYNKGTDLYDVDLFDVNLDFKSEKFGNVKRKKIEGLYGDQLGGLF